MDKEYSDIELICKECGSKFTFTAGEQKFYDEKGFTNQPQRCKNCRDQRKKDRNDHRNNRYNDRRDN